MDTGIIIIFSLERLFFDKVVQLRAIHHVNDMLSISLFLFTHLSQMIEFSISFASLLYHTQYHHESMTLNSFLFHKQTLKDRSENGSNYNATRRCLTTVPYNRISTGNLGSAFRDFRKMVSDYDIVYDYLILISTNSTAFSSDATHSLAKSWIFWR